MKYRSFSRIGRVLLGLMTVLGLANVARADPGAGANVYATGFWGPVAGPRECDATNEDGWCIAWHSVLKGVDPGRLAHCTAWGCDLRPGAHNGPVHEGRDPGIAAQLAVMPHDITPLVLDGQVKPHKAVKGAPRVRVEGPADTRGDHGPIVPLVIEVPAK